MSSEISIDRAADGFKPWHFFVLASILLATVAVIMARRSSPEHLILLSVAIGAAGAAAAALYRALAPFAFPDLHRGVAPVGARQRAALERDKALVLRSIKELEFDRAMGKLSQKDFDEMSARLRARALTLMRQLDAGPQGFTEAIERDLRARLASSGAAPATPDTERASKFEPPAPIADAAACGACGVTNDADAVFCKKCGSRLAA